MEERLKTAYHEAGHCFCAWSEYSHAVRSVCLNVENGQWDGDTNIKRSWFPDASFAPVALAGFLAEAKAIASEINPVRSVTTTPAFIAQVKSIVANELPNGDPPYWDIDVPIDGAQHQTARLTLADLSQIPPDLRTDDIIERSLIANCRFLNKPVHWTVIQQLATELDRLAPKCFGAFRIFVIVREALEEELNADD